MHLTNKPDKSYGCYAKLTTSHQRWAETTECYGREQHRNVACCYFFVCRGKSEAGILIEMGWRASMILVLLLPTVANCSRPFQTTLNFLMCTKAKLKRKDRNFESRCAIVGRACTRDPMFNEPPPRSLSTPS